MNNYYAQGQWNFICDICGQKKKSGDVRLRWDGLRVCRQDWEPRHPQDLLRAKPEKAPPPWVRPEAPDVYLRVCNMITSSGYAGLGAAGCMQAGNDQFTYAFVLSLFDDSLSAGAPIVAPPPPPPPPPPPSSPSLDFHVSSNSQYLPLRSVGGM